MSTGGALAVLVGLAALATVLAAQVGRLRSQRVVTITNLSDDTSMTKAGSVRSVQAADVRLPADAFEAIWTPMHLERFARTYWRFLSRCTLGLIRVVYTERERCVVLVARPLVLLRFQAPTYEMDSRRGVVRWSIERGVLVARAGRGGAGYLRLEVERRSPDSLHIEVEVANFYPAIASRLSSWVYTNTQSRIHVLVTHGFVRSLARLDLAESRIGRFAEIADVAETPRVET